MQVNSNIRCIEIPSPTSRVPVTPVNSNIRCIEIEAPLLNCGGAFG